MKNIFDTPDEYRKQILNTKDLVSYEKTDYKGKSLICVFFTSYCTVGCPFCFFKSPSPISSDNDIKNHFSKEGIEKFIKFANASNLGYLQISGGGEPFLEKTAILSCVEKVVADRIILVTSGHWAYNRKKAEQYLDEIDEAIKKRKTKSRVSIRLSVSAGHSIRLKHLPIKNLIDLFEMKYKERTDFTLQLKTFEEDNTLLQYLDKYYPGYYIRYSGTNKSDDENIFKAMPWQYRVIFKSGYEVIMGKSRIFNPSLRPDLNHKEFLENTIEVFEEDLKQSQRYYPSVVFNSDGSKGLDWIIEYNGNVCTWQNRVQDRLLNIYEDDYQKTVEATFQDPLTLSFIEKGAKYREKIICEISPRTVELMKAVSIRDYAGTLLFEDEKIRLYYTIRVLQDYMKENRLVTQNMKKLSLELQEAIQQDEYSLKMMYEKAEYSVVDQEIKKELDAEHFLDFLELVKLGHYEISAKQLKKAIDYYNCMQNAKGITCLDEIIFESGSEKERRLTERVMTIKQMTSTNNGKIYVFRHGETDWNVEKRIKGQYEGAETIFTEKGRAQIESVGKKLLKNDISIIYASDLMRAKDSAFMASKGLNIPIVFRKELRGLNMGIFQGLMFDEFIKNIEVQAAFRDYSKPIPGGESIDQLNYRMNTFISAVAKKHSKESIAIFSHGAAISNLKALLNKEPYEDIDYCVLVYENGKLNVTEYGNY